MQLQFITGRETIISKIFRVLPGETLVVEAGKIVNRIFLPALPSGGPKKIDQVLALEKLEEALLDSTSVHQRSGCTLWDVFVRRNRFIHNFNNNGPFE